MHWSVFLLLGVAMIIVGINWNTEKSASSLKENVMAKVVWFDGSFRLFRSWKQDWETQEARGLKLPIIELGRADRVEALGKMGLTLEFQGGETLHLERGGLVLLDQADSLPLIIVQRGMVQVENFGNNSVNINHQGKRYTLLEWNSRASNLASDRSAGVSSGYSKRRSGRNEPHQSRDEQPSTREMIDASIKANRTYFMKCFAHLLQRKPQAKGGVTLNFTIQSNGKVLNSEVLDSVFMDRQFHDCIIESLARIPFPSFEGSPIMAMIPLDFQ